MTPPAASPVTIGHDALVAFCADILAAAGVARPEAEQVAARLAEANLTGHESHGVSRVPRYVQMLEQGLILAGQTVSIVTDSQACLLLDGHCGFGQVIGEQAVVIGCDRAGPDGAAVVGLRNSGHLGRIGDWAELAAARGFLSIHMVSVRGRSLVAPYGGMDRRLSTAPLCIGIPQRGTRPMVLDFATSMISEGKAFVAAKGGAGLPDGALISADGAPTTDPEALYGPTLHDAVPNASAGAGALASFGGHKGSGLTFMIEILAGALTGTGVNRTLADLTEQPFRNGMLSIYLDPDRFAGRDYVEQQARDYADYLRAARPAPGHDAVLVPGELETRRRAERLANGIPLSGGTWESLASLAGTSGIAIPDVGG